MRDNVYKIPSFVPYLPDSQSSVLYLRKPMWYNKEKKKIREGGRRKRGESIGREDRVTKKTNKQKLWVIDKWKK